MIDIITMLRVLFASSLLLLTAAASAQALVPLNLPLPTATNEMEKVPQPLPSQTASPEANHRSLLSPPQHNIAAFTQRTINTTLWPLLYNQGTFNFSRAYYRKTHLLPAPQHSHMPVRVLTLADAIWLALRGNPEVQKEQLDRITSKFGLMLEHYELFEPHYTAKLTGTRPLGNKQQWELSPTLGATVDSPLGTSMEVQYTNSNLGVGPDQYLFSVDQPLLKGFGYFSKILVWRNDLDAQLTDRLTYKKAIINIVGQVITAYTALLGQYNTLASQEEDLKITQLSLKQDRLKVKAGQMAPSEYLRQEVQLQSDKASIVDTQNQVVQDFHDFLTQLGLRTDTNIHIEKTIHWKRYKYPSLKRSIAIALQNNIDYKLAKIALRTAKRNYIIAVSNLLPQFDVNATDTVQRRTKANASVGFNLSVPINPMPDRSAELSAKITYQKAKIDLQKQKELVISQITKEWTAVESARVSILLGQKLVWMDNKTLENTKLRLDYGMTTMFEYLTTQESLLTDEITLITDKTTYINNVAVLRADMATTLKDWNIKLRY